MGIQNFFKISLVISCFFLFSSSLLAQDKKKIELTTSSISKTTIEFNQNLTESEYENLHHFILNYFEQSKPQFIYINKSTISFTNQKIDLNDFTKKLNKKIKNQDNNIVSITNVNIENKN